jgi:hypothetical protein
MHEEEPKSGVHAAGMERAFIMEADLLTNRRTHTSDGDAKGFFGIYGESKTREICEIRNREQRRVIEHGIYDLTCKWKESQGVTAQKFVLQNIFWLSGVSDSRAHTSSRLAMKINKRHKRGI